MRVGELMTNIGQGPEGHGQLITDAAISTTCKKCGTNQTLSAAEVRQRGADTEYVCCKRNCGQLVAAVRSQGGTTWGLESVNGLSIDVRPK